MRLSLTSLKGADAKEVASSVTAIANEKIKAEKEANAGKKKTGTNQTNSCKFYLFLVFQQSLIFLSTGKKKQLHIGKTEDDALIDTYDDHDDYDFM